MWDCKAANNTKMKETQELSKGTGFPVLGFLWVSAIYGEKRSLTRPETQLGGNPIPSLISLQRGFHSLKYSRTITSAPITEVSPNT